MEKLQQLKERIAEVDDLHRVMALLEWDQQTYMPPEGSMGRAEQSSTLSKIAHEKFTAPEIGQLIADVGAKLSQADPDSDDAAYCRVAQRDYDRAVKLPTDLVARFARTTALAHAIWVAARKASDFTQFAPTLTEIIGIVREMAAAYGYEEHPYDALMEGFEPGMRTSQVRRIFAELRDGLVPIVQAIAASPVRIRTDILNLDYDLPTQERMTLELLRGIGYDFTRGRQDSTAHPFTTSFGWGDVRVTNRFMSSVLTSAIFSALHEGGHALYDQGLPRRFERTPLASGASYAVHESQSRTWENIVGRSRPFWQFWFPTYQAAFPSQLGNVRAEEFYRAVNLVEPSPIRVEADEVTYNLHVLLRFEIEVGLLEGTIAVSNLPEVWNARMLEYLGYRVRNDAEGVLQDVHWSGGLFGYFPSYTLGNLLSVQFYRQAQAAMPDLEEQFARGEYQGLLAWLNKNIHAYGAKYLPADLTQRVTGGPIDPQPFLSYLKTKYADIYRI